VHTGKSEVRKNGVDNAIDPPTKERGRLAIVGDGTHVRMVEHKWIVS